MIMNCKQSILPSGGHKRTKSPSDVSLRAELGRGCLSMDPLYVACVGPSMLLSDILMATFPCRLRTHSPDRPRFFLGNVGRSRGFSA